MLQLNQIPRLFKAWLNHRRRKQIDQTTDEIRIFMASCKGKIRNRADLLWATAREQELRTKLARQKAKLNP